MPKIMQMIADKPSPKRPVAKKVTLTKEEVDSLKEYCDENLCVGEVIVSQEGLVTRVQVKDLPETLTDISDRQYL